MNNIKEFKLYIPCPYCRTDVKGNSLDCKACDNTGRELAGWLIPEYDIEYELKEETQQPDNSADIIETEEGD